MSIAKKGICLVLALALLTALVGCDGQRETGDAAESSPEGTTAVLHDEALDLSGATTIALSGQSASISGKGAAAEGGVITITAGGTYAVSGTLTEGRILVNAKGAQVTLALCGADITCSYGSPLYVYQAELATVYLAEGTENTLTDGTAYTYADAFSSEAEEEPNACLYSKDDLVIRGSGALTVNGNCNNGITGKDTLQILSASLTVNAVNHGINGKDSNTIQDAAITVTCGGDAVRSTNDTDESLGYVQITGSTLTLTAGEDGIQAETKATLSGGSFTITTGGGSGTALAMDASAKGIKAGTDLALAGGAYVLSCADDAVHANGSITVSGGTFDIQSGDDGFHADETLSITGGTIGISACYEGLEGADVVISGGEIGIVSSDDGVNAAGGSDGSGMMGPWGRGGDFTLTGGGSYSLTISGGTLMVLAGGDGLDSNGSLTISGGTVAVCSTGMADGALDAETAIALEGGTLFAASAGSMAESPSDLSRCALALGFGQTLAAGTCIQFTCGDTSWVFQLTGQATSAVFSAPELTEGAVVTVSAGGTYSGTAAGGLCTGGSYSGGTELASVTLTAGLTASGQTGGMGGFGGKGGMEGGFGGKGGRGDMEQMPTGEMPAGDMPGGGAFPGGDMGGGFGGMTPPEGEQPTEPSAGTP